MESIGRGVAAVPDSDEGPTQSVDLDDTDGEAESPKTQLKCLAVAKASLERLGGLSDVYRNAFFDCQRELRLEK